MGMEGVKEAKRTVLLRFGIVVLAEKSGKVYLPRQALDILRQNGF